VASIAHPGGKSSERDGAVFFSKSLISPVVESSAAAFEKTSGVGSPEGGTIRTENPVSTKLP